jgi:putative glutamine amidotransferase
MRKLIGLTGPSAFTDECKQLVEKHLKQNFVFLYHDDRENLEGWVSKCDAFLISGGVDVHPSIYERDILNHQNMSKFDFLRDLRELAVVDYAITKKKPMLGICRGHQVIGIYHGLKADFCLDLTNCSVVHQPNKSNVSINKGEPVHSVELLDPKAFPIEEPLEREVLKRVMVEEQKKLWVNSFHHQGIYYNPQGADYKGRGIEVLGVACADHNNKQYKVIELMRGDSWISCQWHPEWDYEVNSPSRAVIETFRGMLS